MARHLLILLTGCILLSCTRPPLPGGEPEATLTVSVGSATKADPAGSGSIQDLTVWVFRADGAFDNSATAAGDRLSVRTQAGPAKHIFVAANAPASLRSARTLAAVRDAAVSLGTAPFLMTADTVTSLTGDRHFDLTVTRRIARIRLDTLRNATGHPLTLKRIFLANAVDGPLPAFSEAPAPTAWLHPMGDLTATPDPLLHTALPDIPVPHGGIHTGPYLFCTGPNPTAADASGAPWSPRKTRLVIEVEMGHETYFYPITFPVLEMNTEYRIHNLTLTRPGSAHPDTLVRPAAAIITVSVQGWDKVSYTENI